MQKLRGANKCPNVNLDECSNLLINPDNCTDEVDINKVFCGKGIITLKSSDFQ